MELMAGVYDEREAAIVERMAGVYGRREAFFGGLPESSILKGGERCSWQQKSLIYEGRGWCLWGRSLVYGRDSRCLPIYCDREALFMEGIAGISGVREAFIWRG